MTDIRDLTLLNQPSRPFIRRWSAEELLLIKAGYRKLRRLHWSLEDAELYHPCGDRFCITATGYVLWNEFGDFPDIVFTHLGQALLYIHNT